MTSLPTDSEETSLQTPSTSGFHEEVSAFLRAHATPLDADRRGTGSVSVVPEPPGGDEAATLDDVRRWRGLRHDAGLGWITGPRRFGGRELPSTYEQIYDDLEAAYDVPPTSITRFSIDILGPTLLAHAPDVLLEEVAVPLRRAERIACQLFSEPEAGSDLAAMRTRAVRDGDDWVVDGQKVWSSGAHYSDLGLLIARSSPDAPKHAGLTAFLIDMDNSGVDVRPIRQMTGGSAFSEVFLGAVRVPDARRLGPVDGGWGVAVTALANERQAIGRDGAIDLALVPQLVALVRSRGLQDDPAVRSQVAEIAVRARSNAALTEHVVGVAGQDGPGAEVAAVKWLLTDNLQRIVDLVVDVLGVDLVLDTGTPEAFRWSELVLSLPGLRIGGGTDEILKDVVARRALGLPR